MSYSHVVARMSFPDLPPADSLEFILHREHNEVVEHFASRFAWRSAAATRLLALRETTAESAAGYERLRRRCRVLALLSGERSDWSPKDDGCFSWPEICDALISEG